MPAYNILIENKNSNVSSFGVFLAPPKMSLKPVEFYANSSTVVNAPCNFPVSPIQIYSEYQIGLENSPHPPLNGEQFRPTQLIPAALNQSWEAKFDSKSAQQPTLNKTGTATTDSIDIKTNSYEFPISNNWNSIFFGVNTPMGFMGYTWLAEPSSAYSIVPETVFYIVPREYSPYTLIPVSTFSYNSIALSAKNFDANFTCTVTYNSDGTWTAHPGPPQANGMDRLTEAHLALSKAHHALVQHATSKPSTTAQNIHPMLYTSTGVQTKSSNSNDQINGILSVDQPLRDNYDRITANGVTADILTIGTRRNIVEFAYKGPDPVGQIKQAYAPGTKVLFYFEN